MTVIENKGFQNMTKQWEMSCILEPKVRSNIYYFSSLFKMLLNMCSSLSMVAPSKRFDWLFSYILIILLYLFKY